MTIGKELSHIENATLDDVKAFFFKHYTPANAILVVAGNVTVQQVKELAENGLALLPQVKSITAICRQKPSQTTAKTAEIK